MNEVEAWLLCTLYAVLFVGVLYFTSLDRNHPDVIRKRMALILIVSVVCPILATISTQDASLIWAACRFPFEWSTFKPLVSVLLLFLGPLYVRLRYNHSDDDAYHKEPWRWFRDHIYVTTSPLPSPSSFR